MASVGRSRRQVDTFANEYDALPDDPVVTGQAAAREARAKF